MCLKNALATAANFCTHMLQSCMYVGGVVVVVNDWVTLQVFVLLLFVLVLMVERVVLHRIASRLIWLFISHVAQITMSIRYNYRKSILFFLLFLSLSHSGRKWILLQRIKKVEQRTKIIDSQRHSVTNRDVYCVQIHLQSWYITLIWLVCSTASIRCVILIWFKSYDLSSDALIYLPSQLHAACVVNAEHFHLLFAKIQFKSSTNSSRCSKQCEQQRRRAQGVLNIVEYRSCCAFSMKIKMHSNAAKFINKFQVNTERELKPHNAKQCSCASMLRHGSQVQISFQIKFTNRPNRW